jgi:uncharacterized protein (TIGR02145 family)
MKKKFIMIFFVSIVFNNYLFAQAPQKMSYQAVLRNSSNAIVANQLVNIRITILQGSTNGTSIYSETHTPTTNFNGLISLEIGLGTITSGNFNNINWKDGPFFIKTETDLEGGSNFSITSTSQLLSVPYSLYSETSGNGVPSGGTFGQILTNCNGIPIWTTGGQCPGIISSLECSSANHIGTLTEGTVSNGVISQVPYSGGNGGAYLEQTINSTGVTGLTATLLGGTLSNGTGILTYTITGTPDSAGAANFNLTFNSINCTMSRTIDPSGIVGIATCGATGVHNSSLTYNNMTDQDGNNYKTIVIGTQEWMAENLKVSHYRNGDLIPIITNNATWQNLSNGASSWYSNDSTTYNCPYGKLYNWYAAVDTRKICPLGWHIPTDVEWAILTEYLGGNQVAGGKLKNAGSQYFISPNISADNGSGFSGLPGGYKTDNGTFGNIGFAGYWWSSVQIDNLSAWCRAISNSISEAGGGSGEKKRGKSIRCLKD